MELEYIWRRLMCMVVEKNNVRQSHRAPLEEDFVKPIPAERAYPALGEARLFLSERTPASERQAPLVLTFLRHTLSFKERHGLTMKYPTPWKGTGAPYPPEFERLVPKPELPEDFHAEADKLAGIACRGPFSLHTKQDGRGGFMLDLHDLEPLEPRPPFVRVGGVARFERAAKDRLATVSVEFDGRTCTPLAGSAAWAMAEKRILVALNTYVTVVEHLVHRHLIAANLWSIAMHLAFSVRHPLRVLLQPFVIETMRVNNDQVDGLILSEASNVPSYSGYRLATVAAVIRDAVAKFDACSLDPELSARAQGQLDDPTFVTVESVVRLWRIFRKFTLAWCEAHLPEIDIQTRIFCEELDFRVPNGVKKVLGLEDWGALQVKHVAHLLALGMFAASVGHHVVNDLTRDYMMQFHLMPPAIDADGHPTRGVVYEKRNGMFVSAVKRYFLVDDTVHLPTPVMKRLWTGFQDDLKAYEAEALRDPSARRYRVKPRNVGSSIHA